MRYIALFYRKTGKKILPVTKSESTKLSKNKFRTELKTECKDIINYGLVGKKEFESTAETVEFKDSSFVVYLEGYFYQDEKGNKYYAYDYDVHELLTFNITAKFDIDPKNLNKFTGRKVLEQILIGIRTGNKTSILFIVLPIVCLISGILLGHFLMPQIQYVPQSVVNPSIPSV